MPETLINDYLEELRLKHFMQMLDWGAMSEPKMVYLGLVDKEDYTYYKSHPDKACERRLGHPERLIAALRAKGYRAVSIDSPEAADPSTIVVSSTGIRTPYLDPNGMKEKVERLIKELIQSESVYPMSYPNPRGLTEEADLLDYEHNYQTEFTGYKHPHPDTVKAIMGRYGDEFREEMFQKAFENRISDDYLRRLKTKFGEERFVFSARSYGKEAHENAEKVKRESKERQNEANKKKLNQRLKDSIAHLLDVVIAIKRQNPQNNAQNKTFEKVENRHDRHCEQRE